MVILPRDPSPPSPHLTWSELACRDGTPYPEEWRTTRLPALVGAFETIRASCGDAPIGVRSAYRTPEHNRACGGARDSQHVEGRALDLAPPAGMSVAEFHRIVVSLARTRKIPVRGIGYADARHGSYVHIDTRPGNVLHQWRYPLR